MSCHTAKRAKRYRDRLVYFLAVQKVHKSRLHLHMYAHVCKFLIGVKLQFFPVRIANFLLALNHVYEMTPSLAAEKQTSL